VQLTEWKGANHLQHSQFLGLRDDKDPRDVSQRRWISIAIMRCCHPGCIAARERKKASEKIFFSLAFVFSVFEAIASIIH
jgi:hypothetical protein